MIVIVHGYDGSGAGHWQRWLEAELRQRRVPVSSRRSGTWSRGRRGSSHLRMPFTRLLGRGA
jgi:predicted alpha/beta hydrolase family esterase